jgi:hypothetical protein
MIECVLTEIVVALTVLFSVLGQPTPVFRLTSFLVTHRSR